MKYVENKFEVDTFPGFTVVLWLRLLVVYNNNCFIPVKDAFCVYLDDLYVQCESKLVCHLLILSYLQH
jgi:hypothetical protein